MKHTPTTHTELDQLCARIREYVAGGAYEDCFAPICGAMESYPHAPQPHNLMGIVLEKMGNHLDAMKHFRAAWALDPTYLPANHNLQTYGTFYSGGRCAFDESDLRVKTESNIAIVYDANGIGRAVQEFGLRYKGNMGRR